jgi:thioredoxin 1
MKPNWSLFLGVALVGFVAASTVFARGEQAGTDSGKSKGSLSAPVLRTVDDANHFHAIVRESGSMHLVFEFYADWCRPCRILEPVLLELAKEFEGHFRVYRVDVDVLPELAEIMSVRSVPEVVLFSNGQKIHSIKGLQPKKTYRRAMHDIIGPTGKGTPQDGTAAVK